MNNTYLPSYGGKRITLRVYAHDDMTRKREVETRKKRRRVKTKRQSA